MFDAATRRKIPAAAFLITDAGTPIGYVWPADGEWKLYSPYNAGVILARPTRSAATAYVRGRHTSRGTTPNPLVAEQ